MIMPPKKPNSKEHRDVFFVCLSLPFPIRLRQWRANIEALCSCFDPQSSQLPLSRDNDLLGFAGIRVAWLLSGFKDATYERTEK
jgi:hypothetical protein